MGIKNLQKLNICSNNGNQISLITSFQLCRTELSQRGKHFMTDNGKKLKCNKVIAVLFCIVKDSARCRQDNHQNKQLFSCHFRQNPMPCTSQKALSSIYRPLKKSLACQYCQKDRAQITGCSQKNCQNHNMKQRLDKSDHVSHNLQCTSAFIL